MQTRFVVIPAMPQEEEQFPRRIGVPAAPGAGYDLYDTHGKTRLAFNYPTRAEAETTVQVGIIRKVQVVAAWLGKARIRSTS